MKLTPAKIAIAVGAGLVVAGAASNRRLGAALVGIGLFLLGGDPCRS